MNKTLIAGAIMALVSTGAIAQTVKTSTSTRLTALERQVANLNTAVGSLDTEVQAHTGRLDALEGTVGTLVGAVQVPYTVYDQTGRAVGTTYDGLTVNAEIDGLSYSFTVGQEIDPDYSGGAPQIYFSRDCSGEVYLLAPSIPATPPVERMEGVEYEVDNGPTEGVVLKNPEGGYSTRDLTAEPITWTGASGSVLMSDGCRLGDFVGNMEVRVLPLVPWSIDWVAPLTITPPQ